MYYFCQSWICSSYLVSESIYRYRKGSLVCMRKTPLTKLLKMPHGKAQRCRLWLQLGLMVQCWWQVDSWLLCHPSLKFSIEMKKGQGLTLAKPTCMKICAVSSMSSVPQNLCGLFWHVHVQKTLWYLSCFRDFIEKHYVEMKTHNPKFPILVRECSDVQPRIFARYGEKRNMSDRFERKKD